MRFLLALALSVALFISCGENTKMEHNHENAVADLGDGAYGFVKITEENAISLEELNSQIINNQEPIKTKASGKITKVCQHTGCWVTVEKPDGSEMLVEFKDEFSIPKQGMVGKTIYFQGEGIKETYSVDELKEMARKDGKTQAEIDQIKEPEYEVKFVAEGVLIK